MHFDFPHFVRLWLWFASENIMFWMRQNQRKKTNIVEKKSNEETVESDISDSDLWKIDCFYCQHRPCPKLMKNNNVWRTKEKPSSRISLDPVVDSIKWAISLSVSLCPSPYFYGLHIIRRTLFSSRIFPSTFCQPSSGWLPVRTRLCVCLCWCTSERASVPVCVSWTHPKVAPLMSLGFSCVCTLPIILACTSVLYTVRVWILLAVANGSIA